MTIDQAIVAINDEYNAEVEQAKSFPDINLALKRRIHDEYNELDKQLPDIVADMARACGLPPGTMLPEYVYVACRMCFRLGMRTQRKIDRPELTTTMFWRDKAS